MPGFTLIDDPASFAPWNDLDWGAGGTRNPRKYVDDDATLFSAGGGPVIVNKNGPPAQLQYCGAVDYPVNLADGFGVLTARVPTTRDGPYSAPIFLGFANAVSRLGAYVTAKGDDLLPGSPLHAICWVSAKARPSPDDWTPIAADGVSDVHPIAGGAAHSAPFVGVDGTGEGGVLWAAFQIVARRNYQRLVIGALRWA